MQADSRATTLRDEEEFKKPPFARKETHDTTGPGTISNYAYWVGREPGFAIFRSFKTLNARNLLLSQAEIIYAEEELKKLEKEDP
ncbi:hypothetical protein LTS18_011872, partial [Coniosporium uncinatum]